MTEEDILNYLTSTRTLCFFTFACIYCGCMLLLIKCYLAKLRLFESDVDYFDEVKHGQNADYQPILAPRLKKETTIAGNSAE